MRTLSKENNPIIFTQGNFNILNEYVENSNYSSIFILTDENTNADCFSVLAPLVTFNFEILEIESGEEHKSINTCYSLWEALTELGADRKSLLINLGGGVVTDMGGFVAGTFKRGIDYINIPTSLLAMVDASVGGKTGIDLGVLKNQIGIISSPKMVIINTFFLQTLPNNQMKSGFAEMLKHGLISDALYWKKLNNLSDFNFSDLENLIYESVVIKRNIVLQDPLEKGLRKTLNFGHTIGHAIESYFLDNKDKQTLLHGEAVAVGMIVESYVSFKTTTLSISELNEIKESILSVFSKVPLTETDLPPIINLLKYDKKNEYGEIKFVLLEKIGVSRTDLQVNTETILEGFRFYGLM